MKNETYNGWQNYPTWRVQLELFDGLDLADYGLDRLDTADLADWLREHAESHIEETTKKGLARDYALAFLSYVVWRELAEHAREGYDADNADESEGA
jgi:hypothetical protein